MAEKKKGLGKGLEAIFGEDVSTVLEEIQHSGHNSEEIEVKLIHPNPYQPRQVIMKYNWKISDLENIDLLIHNIDKFISISLGRIGVEW